MEILDSPELAHRLVKANAERPPAQVKPYVAWLPLLKISQIGLQYHGTNSKHPNADFTTNIKTMCPRLRRQGTLESIVYFCPFRGEGDPESGPLKRAYDFASEADRSAYADYLLWNMAQGAHGIDIDYNDWADNRDLPIADVINRAYETVKKPSLDAYVLYCPPLTGSETYQGMASPRMRETLYRVPPEVWPLWAGVSDWMTELLQAKPLTAARTDRWTRLAGRRPFLWVNRVATGAKGSFSRVLPGTKDDRVFAGDLLPRDLSRLFEGVHLNVGVLSAKKGSEPRFTTRELVYLATAADFVWNPHG